MGLVSVVGLASSSYFLVKVLFQPVVRSCIDEFLASWLGDTGNMARMIITTSSGFDAVYLLALRTEAECADYELDTWLDSFRSQSVFDYWAESDSCSS